MTHLQTADQPTHGAFKKIKRTPTAERHQKPIKTSPPPPPTPHHYVASALF